MSPERPHGRNVRRRILATAREEAARLEGFEDAEEMIAEMLDGMAAEILLKASKRKGCNVEELELYDYQPSVGSAMDEARALTGAALAVRLGQHRDTKGE